MTAIPKQDRLEWWPRENVRLNPHNVNKHPPSQLELLARGMSKAWTIPCLVAEDVGAHQVGMLIAGEGRYLAAPAAGYHDTVKVLVAENWTQQMIDEYTIFDNQIAKQSEHDEEAFRAEIQRIFEAHDGTTSFDLGLTQAALDAILDPQEPRTGVKGSLAAAFGVPPFSVLNAREGWWQTRKALWHALGIRSEMGRADHVEGKASHQAAPKGGGRMYGGQRKGGGFAQQTKYARPK